MNLEMGSPGPDVEAQPKAIAWDALDTPLTLKAADEGGAILSDDSGKMWYLDLNEMSYHPLTDADLPAGRLDHFRPYELTETQFTDGMEAAMHVRAKHLEEQIKTLEIVKTNETSLITEGLEEELGLIHAYLRETDPVERGRLRNDLNEMYREMREEPEPEEAALSRNRAA